MQRGRGIQDEPFLATAKHLQRMLSQKQDDLCAGRWDHEIDAVGLAAARAIVVEIRVLEEVLAKMKEASNMNFGEQEL